MEELNPDVDLSIDIHNLTSEFRGLPSTLYRYSKRRAGVDAARDLAKAVLKEVKAVAYKRIKSNVGAKHTEKSLEAEVDTDPEVMEATRKFIRAEHDSSTWGGAVDSMKAKKDCLIQLGADSRKEKQ